MKVIDLSHIIEEGMPVYPGTSEVSINYHNDGGWKHLCLNLNTHAGTHIDAPAHLVPPGGKTIDQYPLDRFVGKGIVYQVLGADDNMEINSENLSPVLGNDTESVPFVILRTRWDRYWGNERYFMNPFISPILAQEFVDRGFSLVGIDFINADSVMEPTGEAHRILLGAGIVIVENLRNLSELDTGKPYLFIFAPLLIADGDGAPTRALVLDG